MQSSRLDHKQLEQVLENMFALLKTKGIDVSDSKKKEIKDTICEDLYQNPLSRDEIKHPEVQKKLMFCMTSLIMGKENDYKSMMEVLKSDDPQDKQLNDKELEAKHGKKFATDPKERILLLALLTILIDPKKQNENSLTSDAFTRLVLTYKNQSKKPEDEEEAKKQQEEDLLIAKRMDECLRNLFGGENPTVSGKIDFPILGPIFGNLFGFTDQSSANPEDVSFMVKAITYNAGPDYLGLENLIKTQDLGEGILDNVFSLRPEMH